jgi:rhodanese-related sulfurtransferase
MDMRRALTLCLLGLLLLAGCRSFRNRERPPFRKVIPPVAFEILRDNPDVLVLDLRSRQEFLSDTGHIYRARNIPVDRLAERMLEIAAFRDDTFLVYCRDGDSCGEEGMAILISSGFENAILIEGGIDGWIRYGFRTVLPAPEGLPPSGGSATNTP